MRWRQIDGTEFLSGLLLLVLGALVLVESWSYPVGRMGSIGPGAFPRALAILMMLCGLGAILGSLAAVAPFPNFKLRAFLAVCAGLGYFALTVTPFGVVPAVFGLTVIARLAEPRQPPWAVLALGIALSILCWAIFVWGLNLPLRAFRWPF